MWAIELALVLVSVFPRVEDPWPNTVGIDLPFAMAGAGGVLASALHTEASEMERDEAIRKGGLWGFWLGVAIYALALLNQIISGR